MALSLFVKFDYNHLGRPPHPRLRNLCTTPYLKWAVQIFLNIFELRSVWMLDHMRWMTCTEFQNLTSSSWYHEIRAQGHSNGCMLESLQEQRIEQKPAGVIPSPLPLPSPHYAPPATTLDASGWATESRLETTKANAWQKLHYDLFLWPWVA